MPLDSKDFDLKPICFGSNWSEKARAKLVENLGDLVCGLFIKVANKFLGTTSYQSSKYDHNKYPIQKLKSTPVHHRDGWLFQMISFLCLLQKHGTDKTVFIAHPHMQPADKGFDNLLLKFNPVANQIDFIMITEDKATKNPRTTFKTKVLPEFKSIEEDDRTSQLITCTSALLKQSGLGMAEMEREISRFFWNANKPKVGNELRYRVNITAKSTVKPKNLFKDYDSIVKGDISRRRAEVFVVDDLRPWMQKLSDEIVNHIS